MANKTYDEQAVIEAIAQALDTFYENLIRKIDDLNINKVMKRKNPYLYRAKAMQSASDIVDSVLTAFVSSSEETIFGNCFFEPIAIAASNGNKALAEGIDIMIQDKETNTISAFAVKSGPSVFNADSKKGRKRILWLRQSWRNRPKPVTKPLSDTAMARKKIPDAASLKYIRSLPEKISGGKSPAKKIFTFS